MPAPNEDLDSQAANYPCAELLRCSHWGLSVRPDPTHIPYSIPQPETPLTGFFGADGRPSPRVFPYGPPLLGQVLSGTRIPGCSWLAAELVASFWAVVEDQRVLSSTLRWAPSLHGLGRGGRSSSTVREMQGGTMASQELVHPSGCRTHGWRGCAALTAAHRGCWGAGGVSVGVGMSVHECVLARVHAEVDACMASCRGVCVCAGGYIQR